MGNDIKTTKENQNKLKRKEKSGNIKEHAVDELAPQKYKHSDSQSVPSTSNAPYEAGLEPETIISVKNITIFRCCKNIGQVQCV